MKKNIVIFIGFILLLAIGFFLIPNLKEPLNKDSYIYVTSDSLGEWYFDYSSIEERMDDEEDISVIDVWVKRDINLESNNCVRDELLWHIDVLNMRYKVSDAFAYDTEDALIET